MYTKKDSENKKGHTYVQWLFAILTNTTLLSYGLQSGWISPTTKLLQSDESPSGRPLTDSEISWIASMPSLAAVVGVPIYMVIADKYGRKTGVLMITSLQALCWIINIASSNVTSLIISRVCCGLAAAGCFNVIPMYVKEISQDDIRGVLGSLFVLMQNIGILTMYIMGAYLDYYVVLWIVVTIPILASIALLKAPESPTYLVKIGKIDEATSTIAFLRGVSADDKSVEVAVDAIKQQDEYFKSIPNVSFVSIFKDKAWRRGFLIILAVFFAHSLNGAMSIVMYASAILESAGVTMNPELQSLSLPAFMIVGSLLSMSMVDKLGRKPILATAFIVSTVMLCFLASLTMVQQHGFSVPGLLPVVAVAIIACMYAGGVSSMPYIVMSEMFNFQIRTKVMGFVVMYAYAFSFLQLVSIGPISSVFGSHITFFGFAIFNAMGAIFTLILLPETKAKSVEQIETELRGK